MWMGLVGLSLATFSFVRSWQVEKAASTAAERGAAFERVGRAELDGRALD